MKRKQSTKENPKQLPNSYLSWCIYPGQMAKMGVHRNRHHFTVHITEFICFIAESHNFCRAYKSAGWEQKESYNDSATFCWLLSKGPCTSVYRQ